MKSKKPLVLAGVSTMVGLAAFAGVASAQAPKTINDQQSLAAKIAAKFNLKQSDVQAVIDEDHTAHEADMKQRFEAKLDQAVADGKITSDQKTAILDKLKEMQDYKASIADKSDAEQRQLMKAKIDEIYQWAQDNGLSDYVPMHHGLGHFMKGGPMGPMEGGTPGTATDN